MLVRAPLLPLRPVPAAATGVGAAAPAAEAAGASKAAGAEEEGLRAPLAAGGTASSGDATVTLDGGSLVATPLARSSATV